VTEQTPQWPQGFMGSNPQPMTSQPSAAAISTQPVAPQQQPGRPPLVGRGYDRFVIPKSVVETSHYWTGADSDLIFGMREPTGGESSQLAAEKSDFETAVPRFIVQIGDVAVTDYTVAQVWWTTILTSKARTLVVSAFIKMLIPSDSEGESLFASRTRVG
jgi:hypothetical protein